MPYCKNCGNKLENSAKFCPKCGSSVNDETSPNTQQNTNSGINCPKCGSLIPFGNVACSNCGNLLYQDSHTTAIILGYICSIFIPLFGIIFAIYLLTRPNTDVRKHGIIMIIISIAIMIIAYFWFSYMAYVNSLRSYRYYYY